MSSENTGSAGSDHEAEIDRLVADYIDRYNLGESLSPDIVLAEHPRLAPEILAQLEAFLDIEGAGENPGLLREVGDFRLVRRLGSGGMGVVYEAWEESLDRKVAVKLLPAGAAADGTTLRRFHREARAAGRLNHRNIVSVYAMGLASGTPYYSMEYVDGETLAALRTRLGIVDGEPKSEVVTRRALIELISLLPQPDMSEPKSSEAFPAASLPALRARYARVVAHAFAQVARGLQHAHEQGIVHRDIKPGNLILDRETSRRGTARGLRILDFGLARLAGDETLTIDGAFLGTPLYMSPEQVRSAQGQKVEVDRSTDVYSLGLCLYEMLAWRHPFGQIGQQIYRDTLEREPPPLVPLVHRDLDAIVSKCLRKAPRERYATAEALAQDLDRFVRSEPVEAKPLGPWRRTLRRLWAARRKVALAAAFLVLATGAALGLHQFFRGSGGIRTAGVWEGDTSMSHTRVSLEGNRMVAVDWSLGNLVVKDVHSDEEWYDVTHNKDWSTLTHYGNAAIISPDGTKICYCWEHSDTGRGELYIAEVDGSNPPRRLVPGEGRYYPEDWSRDGARILVQRNCSRSRTLLRGGCSLVLLSIEDGSFEWEWEIEGRERLLNPRLSPDGQWIFYQREEKAESGRWDILARNLATNETLSFLGDLSDDRLIAISADGNQVVFASDREGGSGLFTARCDAGRLVGRPRCIERAFYGEGAGITSDGTLYYQENLGSSDVFLAGFDRGGRLDVSGAEPASHRFQSRCYAPSWSPDGTRLAYRVDARGYARPYGESSWKLIVQNVSTGEEEEISPDPPLPGKSGMIGPDWLDNWTLVFRLGALDNSSTFYTIDIRERKRRVLHHVKASIGIFASCVGSGSRAIWYRRGQRGFYRFDVPDDPAGTEPPEPHLILDSKGGNLKLSPDEEWLAYRDKKSIWRVRADGSENELVYPRGDGRERLEHILCWRGNRSLILQVGDGLRELDVETGEHWPIVEVGPGICRFAAVSPVDEGRVATCWETFRTRISKLEDFLR